MKHCGKKFKKDKEEDGPESYPTSLECVLSDEITNDSLPVIQVYVGTVPDKKFIRNVIMDLNRVLPISDLQHLKRVSKNQIIICFTSEGSEVEIFAKLCSLGFNLKLIKEKLDTVSVAQFGPKSRKQFVFSNKLWPTNFHEDKYLESLLSKSVFSVDELKSHAKWMQLAVEAARRSEVRSGTAVIDPITNEVLAVAGDSRLEHPLRHSVMVAVDLVARAQGGGAWPPHPADFFSSNLIRACTVKSEDVPYLCTNYYVYTTREPCTMCAMALVHSRVKRVFYGVPSPKGALGTILKVHTLKNLNHHFEVFKGLLQNEINFLS